METVGEEEERSLAFEVKGTRMNVIIEDALPFVQFKGVKYFVSEAPSVTVGGKKHFVNGIY
ncbi:MAG: hypothetical protein N3G80_03260 [Candidatus Micrarchaeota archaeon]|nr:hypothetical protein [Candidatus Micrarchaeota archaeon]